MNNTRMWSLTVASLMVLGLAVMPAGEAKNAPDRQATIVAGHGDAVAVGQEPQFDISDLNSDDCFSNLTNQIAWCAACAQWGAEFCSGCLDKYGKCGINASEMSCTCEISCRVCTQSGERMRADIY
jgi:hypothetical protein